MSDSRIFTVDEKIRLRNFPDVLLEEWSDRDRQIPGWILKPLLCDFILYVNVPGGRAYLLPTLQLQAAWARSGEEWKRTRDSIPAHNRDPRTGREWTSINWPIAVEELFPKIGACLRASFDP